MTSSRDGFIVGTIDLLGEEDEVGTGVQIMFTPEKAEELRRFLHMNNAGETELYPFYLDLLAALEKLDAVKDYSDEEEPIDVLRVTCPCRDCAAWRKNTREIM